MIIENICRYLEDNLEFARLIINNNMTLFSAENFIT